MVQRRVTILLALVIAGAIAYSLLSSGPQVPERSVLAIELSGDLPDAPVTGLAAQLRGGGGLALPTLQLQLDKAARDERIEGVLLHIRGLQLGLGRRRELHDMIARVRDSGKQVVALIDMERINSSTEAYVAAAASKVYVVPGFMGPVTGIAGEVLLLGGLLERVGVDLEYERIGAYKSAPESYAATELSAPAREMYAEIMDGLFADFIEVIAAGRKLSPERVRELVSQGPSTGSEWVEAGIADGISSRSDVLEMAGFEDAKELELSDYMNVDARALGLRDGAPIALVFGEGAIVTGGGATGFSADRISKAIDRASEDESIRAIVLRVNSPGGSPLASDQVWRSVRAARENKPVVVSMSDTAASGGYYVASAATSVVAQPTTQTGSIGVFILRPSIGELLEKLGVSAEPLQRGELAGLGGASRPLTEPQRSLLERLVRSAYADFLARVSEGRELPTEEVDKVGQGRVWLGSRALELKLVDQLGGLDTAIELAKQAAKIPADEDPARIVLPEAPPLRDQLRQLIGMTAARAPWPLEWVLTQLPNEWRGIEEIPPGIVQLVPHWVRLQ